MKLVQSNKSNNYSMECMYSTIRYIYSLDLGGE